MTHTEYLNHLEKHLHQLPEQEKQEVLADYQEHFEMGMLEGREASEIAKDLGHPRDIAKEVYLQFRIENAETNKSITNLSQAILSTMSLGLFNLIIVLGPAIALLGIYISLWAAVFSLYVGAIGVFFVTSSSGVQLILLQLFSAMVLAGLGIMLTIGLIKLGNMLYQLFMKYVKWNVKIVKGENYV
ncbi:HAAS signaling domain-containing protein [Pontibacillus yanchengensis]|uniref:Membrane protein n=1 Tax=Pontibacillus yanchengensis Y32 TaxID=1385514 RepID=A0A0A2TRY6_9BACI|nr:DUF1700 domain-containing protein [Pontibacillus yanchengensis]KGP72025.1 membrane protein [Pontibacillus yanchengensis Y32]